MASRTVWLSGLRCWLQAPVRKGVGSNPTAVTLPVILFVRSLQGFNSTGAEQRVVTNFGTRQRRWLSRWNEWVLLVCDMEKYTRPALQHVYLEPKWLRCPQCCSGLELIGPAHEELETPEAVLGAGIDFLRLEVILLSKEKAAAPRPKPRGRPRGRSCGRPRGRPRGGPRGGPRGTGRQTLQNLPNLNPLQNPPNTFPNRHPRAKATSQSGPPGPRPQQWLSIGFQSCRLPARKHSKRSKTLQTLQTPSKTPNPPGLEACFEQVAQGLWLVRRVHRRSKTISLPGRLELPTLRLTASRSNQLSYGSLCRRPKLVPVLEKRLNNSWLQMVCQTKGQQPK